MIGEGVKPFIETTLVVKDAITNSNRPYRTFALKSWNAQAAVRRSLESAEKPWCSISQGLHQSSSSSASALALATKPDALRCQLCPLRRRVSPRPLANLPQTPSKRQISFLSEKKPLFRIDGQLQIFFH